jgi:hypothetical protein
MSVIPISRFHIGSFALSLALTVLLPAPSGKANKQSINKGKHFTMGKYQLTEAEFDIDDLQFHVIHTNGYDSVHVTGNEVNYTFIAGPTREPTFASNVAMPVMHYLDHNKVLHIDTLRETQDRAFQHQYFYSYQSSRVTATYTPSLHQVEYFYDDGHRQKLVENYPYGPVQQVTWYDTHRSDTAIRTYSREGVLESYRNIQHELRTYYPNGVVQSFGKDTVIAERRISSLKSYHTNGKMKSRTYHYQDTPCGTWRYYNTNGQLVKTQAHKAITSFPKNNGPVVGAPPEPEYQFIFVVQMPEYPRGDQAFTRYMDENLAIVLARSEYELGGPYTIRMRLDAETGKMKFLDVKGWNSGAIQSGLKQLCVSMPAWKPGKRNGRRMSEVFEIKATVD